MAVPQIGVSLQAVIFGFEKNQHYPDADEVLFTVLLNPQLTPLSDEMEDGWEGCLSVPGIRGVVPRVMQHECDHLQGILYPMHVKNCRLFGFSDALFPGQVVVDD